MLKLIGWFIKASIFAAIVLVLGNVVRWDGKTISERVKAQVSNAEKAPIVNYVTSWSSGKRKPTRAGRPANAPSAQNAAISQEPPQIVEQSIREQAAAPMDPSEMLSSERQKLRVLIRELNSPRIAN